MARCEKGVVTVKTTCQYDKGGKVALTTVAPSCHPGHGEVVCTTSDLWHESMTGGMGTVSTKRVFHLKEIILI